MVLFFLHRRHMRRLRQEDATDKTKSMDFGMDIGPAHAKRTAALSGEKVDSRSRRQMSMDMDMVASPYLLPNAVSSHDSLARTIQTDDSRYGRAAGPHSPLSPSSRSRLPLKADPSIYAQSLGNNDSPDGSRSNMDAGLLDGAQRMPTSTPPPPRSAPLAGSSPPVPRINLPKPPRAKSPSVNEVSAHTRGAYERHSQEPAPPRSSDGASGLPTALQVGGGSAHPPHRSESPFDDPVVNPVITYSSAEPYDNDDDENSASPPNQEYHQHGQEIQFRFSDASTDEDDDAPYQPSSVAQRADDRKSLAPMAADGRRLSMGFRPLPPDGNPDDTAEERAMRIRSFYKEYFSAEDSAAGAPPIPQTPAQYQQQYAQARYQDEYSMGYDDHTVFDSETGRFVVPDPGARPFAEPPTRRAMTPPPRMPPRFMGRPGPRSRTGSAAGGHFMPPDPRSYSSASGRMPGRPQPHRRPREPPRPLNVLPTPSMMDEGAFASPHMFAPPMRINRDDSDVHSLRGGGMRPYSPSVSPHVPLASAFDDLAAMPSPHALRKSTTYTALDFAPPRKFRNDGEMSDAGSIRSNRSGASALQVQNIRNGAYRVSRIPLDVVPLRDDMTAGLKPTWDLGYGSAR